MKHQRENRKWADEATFKPETTGSEDEGHAAIKVNCPIPFFSNKNIPIKKKKRYPGQIEIEKALKKELEKGDRETENKTRTQNNNNDGNNRGV